MNDHILQITFCSLVWYNVSNNIFAHHRATSAVGMTMHDLNLPLLTNGPGQWLS